MVAYEILIADDHPLFRSALQQALTMGLGAGVRLVEVASIAELEARPVSYTHLTLPTNREV